MTNNGWIIGITGASGAAYSIRLLGALAERNIPIHLVISHSAVQVLKDELGKSLTQETLTFSGLTGIEFSQCQIHSPDNIGASIASGSFKTIGMVVVPCSMGSLAAISNGTSSNLIHRAADVTLKECRKLILVPRETPFSKIHLRNMLSVAEAGATIVPAMPGFYHSPQNINDIVDMLVMKILDQMGIENTLTKRWS